MYETDRLIITHNPGLSSRYNGAAAPGADESAQAAHGSVAADNFFAKIAEPLIAQGFRIIPLKARGKTPLLPSWKEYQDRAPTAEEYAQWFDDYPEANVGILTGITVDVLDVDNAVQADEYLAKQTLPQTRIARTGKPDGRHYYFKHPPELKISCSVKNLPGMDVRGNGGYVVGPGSIHENGTTYVWEAGPEIQLADMPSWLIKASAANKHDPHYKFTLTLAQQAETLARAEEGARNDTWNKAVFLVAKLAKNDDDRRLIEERLVPIARKLQEDDDIGIRGTLQSAFSAAQRKAAEEAASPVKWPYELRVDSVFLKDKKSSQTEQPDPEGDHFIMSHLKVIAWTRNQEGGGWGKLLEFSDPDGRPHQVAVPQNMLEGDGADLRKQLGDDGLKISPRRAMREHVLGYIVTTDPSERRLAVSRIGWDNDRRRFVLPDKVFGPTSGEGIVYQTEGRLSHNFKVKGTLQEWQQRVATPCIGNPLLLFSLSVAFAAPLLAVTDSESGGFHLVGASSTGKTTALRVAGSVWGGGGMNGNLQSWRATDNGLEGIAESHSDTLLPLDEMSQAHAIAAAQTAFMLANGQGKGRMKQDSSMRKLKEWNILFLSTGNVSLTDKINENGQRSTAAKEQGGQEVRIVDISADAGAGLGLFEDLHSAADGAAFSTMLKEATNHYYGTASRAFLERLTAGEGIDGPIEEARSKLKAYMKQFVESLALSQEAGGQVRRVADRFALAAAAGKLATEWGILPCSADDAFSAARKCFKAWVANRGGTGSSEDMAYRAKLVTKIQQGQSHFEIVGPPPCSPDDRKYSNRAAIGERWGFRELVQGEGWHLYIFTGTWRETLCQGIPYQHGAKLMIADGFMDALGDNGRPKKYGMTNPDGSKGKSSVRYYHILPALAGGPDSAQEHEFF
jgi:putative DNA primase/helicase